MGLRGMRGVPHYSLENRKIELIVEDFGKNGSRIIVRWLKAIGWLIGAFGAK